MCYIKEARKSDEHSPKSEFNLRSLDTAPINAEPLSDKKKVKEAYSSDKKEKGRIGTLNKEEEDPGAASSEEQKETLPCAQTLHFLQRNIVIASASVAGVLVVMVALLFLLANCGRCKWARAPPADMTYNIFVMNGKTWWQKFQEHAKPRKSAEKQEQLSCDSYI
ncbi:uncharacterized protein C2orf92-like [Choloepus didactylus]|uniref:uncharacterized protein C2orf92-like n=1 Tax=Choloepus didactylus TaxID=27675 RepID=UPI0018A03BEB|nr:uncharacterized protein C2orf92-like [Choloepus didactylus]